MQKPTYLDCENTSKEIANIVDKARSIISSNYHGSDEAANILESEEYNKVEEK